MSKIEDFKVERERLTNIVMKYAGLETKRFFSLDSQVYREGGALPVKIKELLGLVASMVLRCDDCINYHIIRCYEKGITNVELEEAMSISLIVGGSITIPHMRRAYDSWEELNAAKQ